MYINEIKRLDNSRPYVIEARNEYGDLQVHMKWDGCIDLYKYSNGYTIEEHSEDNVVNLHICEVKEFIKELQDVVKIAEQNFHKDDFEKYWN